MKLKTKFQDENFELGEVVEADIFYGGPETSLKVETRAAKGGYHTFYCGSLKELNELFEDYEETKEFYWVIDEDGALICRTIGDSTRLNEGMCKQIGNYFETKEEAEKAVERLQAWKRLKDKGIVIRKLRHNENGGEMYWSCPSKTGISDKQIWLDLDLLFGGEE
jgi:hypothetical protein